MKKIFLILLCCAATTVSIAQEYEDLKSLYIDGRYDKLAEKALKYTEKEKTMNDPLPYLYLAKGLFKITMDEKYKHDEQFKSAEMESLNYYTIYKKKDKGGIYKDLADAFLAEMKSQIYEESENFYAVKNYKKTLAFMKRIIKIEPENAGALIYKGLCEYGVANKTEGKKNIEQALAIIKKMDRSVFDKLMKEDQHLMKTALMEYTNFLVAQKDFSGAKSAITLGYQYYKVDEKENKEEAENADYEALYNKVVNG